MAFREDSTGTYTFPSNSTGSTVDLGAKNSYRYVNAVNVYNKGKEDGGSYKAVFIEMAYPCSSFPNSNLSGYDYIIQIFADFTTNTAQNKINHHRVYARAWDTSYFKLEYPELNKNLTFTAKQNCTIYTMTSNVTITTLNTNNTFSWDFGLGGTYYVVFP